MLRGVSMLCLIAPVHVFLAPIARPHAPIVLRARLPAIVASESDDYYRTLGVGEDAGYDEIMDAYMELNEKYAGDDARLADLETAKDKVLDLKLRARMEGSLQATYDGMQAREDRPPTPTTPIMEIVNDYRKKLFGLPAKADALRIIGLLGGLTAATWVAPTTAGTILLINTVSAMGFMYNRGEPDVPRDDFGQIGEIRPMKPKPFMLTSGIALACWLFGFIRAKQIIAMMVQAPRGLELVLRTSLISCTLMIPCLFVKVQPLFENDY